jgi:hypothetical protein
MTPEESVRVESQAVKVTSVPISRPIPKQVCFLCNKTFTPDAVLSVLDLPADIYRFFLGRSEKEAFLCPWCKIGGPKRIAENIRAKMVKGLRADLDYERQDLIKTQERIKEHTHNIEEVQGWQIDVTVQENEEARIIMISDLPF